MLCNILPRQRGVTSRSHRLRLVTCRFSPLPSELILRLLVAQPAMSHATGVVVNSSPSDLVDLAVSEDQETRALTHVITSC